MKSEFNRFYCGTSNVVLPVANKSFFPEGFRNKSRLQYYASLFNSVEINSTFYKLPMPRTIERWAEETPPDFRFSFKFWKSITHVKEFNYESNDVKRFLDVVNAIGVKKGCLLIQFPGSITVAYFASLKRLLNDACSSGATAGWHLAVEFRDPSWYRDEVYELLTSFEASVVIHDIPKSATPYIDMERSFYYIRFHGERGDYRGCYSDSFLDDQAENVRSFLDESKPVYAYFNNTIGDAVHNAADLYRSVMG